jgi:hypothetical protein
VIDTNPVNAGKHYCVASFGFLPAASLGLTSVDAQGYAVDGNRQPANRIRYAIWRSPVAGVVEPFTAVNGMRNVGMQSLALEDLFFVLFRLRERHRSQRGRRLRSGRRPDLDGGRRDLVARRQCRDGRRECGRGTEPKPQRQRPRSHFRQPSAKGGTGRRIR